jgi:hypothetical protein
LAGLGSRLLGLSGQFLVLLVGEIDGFFLDFLLCLAIDGCIKVGTEFTLVTFTALA